MGTPNNGAYTNDANGNTLTGGGKTNTWDSQNRLVKVVKAGITSEFTYGCDGLRRRSVVTNAVGEATQTDYVYDGQNMIAEVVRHYTGGSQVGQTENVSYLQGPSGPLYRKSSLQADPKWYVYDGLGSVVGEIDVLGNLAATKTHDVYGLTRNVTGSPTSRQGFVGGLGHVSDDETGLVYMRARHYDPSVGRFESQDPARQGENWFAYCGGDTVNRVDRTGRSWEAALMAFVEGVAGPVLACDFAFAIIAFIGEVIKREATFKGHQTVGELIKTGAAYGAVLVACVLLALTPFGWATLGCAAALIVSLVILNYAINDLEATSKEELGRSVVMRE